MQCRILGDADNYIAAEKDFIQSTLRDASAALRPEAAVELHPAGLRSDSSQLDETRNDQTYNRLVKIRRAELKH
jgi:hypothetical protein